MRKILLTILITSFVTFPAWGAFAPAAADPTAQQGGIYTTSSGIMHSGRLNRGNNMLGAGSGLFNSGSSVSTGSMSFGMSNMSSSVNRGNLSVVAIHNEVCQNLNINALGSMPQGPRRKIKEPEDQAPIGQEDPISPVGDAMIPLLLLAAAYGLFRKRQLQN